MSRELTPQGMTPAERIMFLSAERYATALQQHRKNHNDDFWFQECKKARRVQLDAAASLLAEAHTPAKT